MRKDVRRRDLLALAALSVSGPAASGDAAMGDSASGDAATGNAASGNTGSELIFVPRAMPESLDPIATPTLATRTAAFAVFETLYGTDDALNPRPQMVQSHRMDDDGAQWSFRLRPGLLFHDGAAVTAADCVASLRRWMARDRVGQGVAARLIALDATDRDTLTLRLKKPLPMMPAILARATPAPPVIMPARLAETDPGEKVAQVIGSGPFQIEGFAWNPGMELRLSRFDRYVPRTDIALFTGGRRIARVDRVIWRMVDDPAAALRAGKVDWVETLPPDPDALRADDAAVTTRREEKLGYYALLRLNARSGSTANRGIRQAILAAIDQTAIMLKLFGLNTDAFTTPVGLFPPTTDSASEAGMERTGARQSPRTIRTALKEAGYRGEKLIMLTLAGDAFHARMTAAVIEQLTELGIGFEEQTLDRAAFDARRGERDGWSAFCASVSGADHADPLSIPAARGSAATTWFGGPDDAEAERLRDSWIDMPDLSRRRAIAARLQDQVFRTASFVPLGQWFPVSAWRTAMNTPLPGPFPVFWDVGRK